MSSDSPLASDRKDASPAVFPQGENAPFAIVTCMDARIDTSGFFALWQTPLHVIRNAGGRVTSDVLRSLAVSCTVGIQQIVIAHHTQCRMAERTDEEIRQLLPQGAGEGLEVLAIREPREALREDVLKVRESPLVPDEVRVVGLIYDLDSRAMNRVDPLEELKAQPF